MKVNTIDFHAVQSEHQAIHRRLENWARLVKYQGMHWVAPIWKRGRSNGRQWETPVLMAPVDTLQGWRVEKAVAALPQKHREAVRWAYVYKDAPAKRCRDLGLTHEGLDNHVRSGRQMLLNCRAGE